MPLSGFFYLKNTMTHAAPPVILVLFFFLIPVPRMLLGSDIAAFVISSLLLISFGIVRDCKRETPRRRQLLTIPLTYQILHILLLGFIDLMEDVIS